MKEIVNLFAITYDFVCMTVFLTAMFSDLLLKPAHSLGQIILRISLVLCMIGVINIQYTRYKSKLIFLSSTLLNHLIFSFYHHHRESAKAAKLLENEFATALTILRLRIFFREKSPYLNPNISLGDVAKALGTDKLRISQSIKIHAGGNFRTFVNAYRIDYSMKAFKKDNNLKVYDLAYISGFKSTRAFIMAFR